MKLNLKKEKHEDTVKILKAIASRNKDESERAQEALAAFVAPAVTTVLDQVATNRFIYRTVEYNFDEVPEIPIDLYFDDHEGLFYLWSNSVPGGMATNEIYGADSYRFRTFRLDSAISFPKSYAQNARLDVVAKGIERLVQEVLAKEEYQAWSVIMAALGGARTQGMRHIIDSNAKTNSLADNLLLHDFSQLLVRQRRLNPSWLGGTAVAKGSNSLTDVFMSPEALAKVRAWAYNPLNTDPGPTSGVGTEVGSTVGIPLPDSMRQKIYDSAGMSEIYGIRLHEMNELGVNQPYNLLFDANYTATGGDPTFAGTTDELVIGFDLGQEAFIKAIRSDRNGTFELLPDDQFLARQEKVGWYGYVEEGFLCGNNRAVGGIVW